MSKLFWNPFQHDCVVLNFTNFTWTKAYKAAKWRTVLLVPPFWSSLWGTVEICLQSFWFWKDLDRSVLRLCAQIIHGNLERHDCSCRCEIQLKTSWNADGKNGMRLVGFTPFGTIDPKSSEKTLFALWIGIKLNLKNSWFKNFQFEWCHSWEARRFIDIGSHS